MKPADDITSSSNPGAALADYPVEEFFRLVDAVPASVYPPQLAPVAGRHVDGVAGFPAGRGLYAPCGWDHGDPPPFPYGGLMLVGNHLDAEEPYLRKVARGHANGDPCEGAPRMRFWTMLYALLDEATLPRESIFVTNVHPALLRGDDARGTVRASRQWLDICAGLLGHQIEVMRPRVVAAMGAPAQRFMGRMLGVRWPAVPSAVDVEFLGQRATAVAMRHPSAAQSLEHRRMTADVLRTAAAVPTR